MSNSLDEKQWIEETVCTIRNRNCERSNLLLNYVLKNYAEDERVNDFLCNLLEFPISNTPVENKISYIDIDVLKDNIKHNVALPHLSNKVLHLQIGENQCYGTMFLFQVIHCGSLSYVSGEEMFIKKQDILIYINQYLLPQFNITPTIIDELKNFSRERLKILNLEYHIDELSKTPEIVKYSPFLESWKNLVPAEKLTELRIGQRTLYNQIIVLSCWLHKNKNKKVKSDFRIQRSLEFNQKNQIHMDYCFRYSVEEYDREALLFKISKFSNPKEILEVNANQLFDDKEAITVFFNNFDNNFGQNSARIVNITQEIIRFKTELPLNVTFKTVKELLEKIDICLDSSIQQKKALVVIWFSREWKFLILSNKISFDDLEGDVLFSKLWNVWKLFQYFFNCLDSYQCGFLAQKSKKDWIVFKWPLHGIPETSFYYLNQALALKIFPDLPFNKRLNENTDRIWATLEISVSKFFHISV